MGTEGYESVTCRITWHGNLENSLVASQQLDTVPQSEKSNQFTKSTLLGIAIGE